MFMCKGHSQGDGETCADVLKESGRIESSKGHSRSFENIHQILTHSTKESNSRSSAESCSSSESKNSLSFLMLKHYPFLLLNNNRQLVSEESFLFYDVLRYL